MSPCPHLCPLLPLSLFMSPSTLVPIYVPFYPCPYLCPILPLFPFMSPSTLVPIYVPFYPCPHLCPLLPLSHLCPLVPIDTKEDTNIACPQDPGKSEDYEISSTTLATVESIEELTEDNYEEDSSSFYNVNIHTYILQYNLISRTSRVILWLIRTCYKVPRLLQI